MPVLQVAPSSGQNRLSSSSHGGATERCQFFKWRHLPDQNWLSSSHGGATERCQFLKWRHLPDKTGYHHHHMVAPLSGARYSSGAIFLTKTAYHHHHMVATLSGVSSSSGAIFRTKTGHRHHHHMMAPLSGARYSSGAIFRTKLVIIIITWWRHERCQVFKCRHLPDKTGHHHHHHMMAPLSGARYSSGAIFRTKLVIIITWWRH